MSTETGEVHEHGIALFQSLSKTTGGSESEAVLECLEALELTDALISVDAASSVKRVSDKIREKKADYLMPIKKNQRHSLKEIEEKFQEIPAKEQKKPNQKQNHGRIETRRCDIISAKNMSAEFKSQWRDVQTIIRIQRSRDEKDPRYVIQKRYESGKNFYAINSGERRTTNDTVYFISSKKLAQSEALNEVREHWGIENKLHWSLDVVFSEDNWRVRDKNAARNLSLMIKFAFNLIKACTQKGSQRLKMKRAAWSTEYMEELIFAGI